MNSDRLDAAAGKPAFEPSDLIEHGDADELTRGPISSNQQGDGTYTS